MIRAADRLMSDLPIWRAAIRKSAGEQSAGQAVLQGFSSQYRQRSASALSWASDRKVIFFFMVHLGQRYK